jgi:hypothetical protein
MGRLSLRSGRVWRLQLDGSTAGVSNNTLEFLAATTTIVLEQHDDLIPKYGQVLALTDSSSTVSWMNKMSASPSSSGHLYSIAPHLALHCMEHQFCLHPQHIRGCNNSVTDALSRLHHLSDTELTSFLLSNFP